MLVPPAAFAAGGGRGEKEEGEEEGEEDEVEVEGGVIDLLSCQEVVRKELERLEGELGRQTATLARRYRR